MADLVERQVYSTTTDPSSQVEKLVQDSTVSYSRPAETQPSVPITVALSSTPTDTIAPSTIEPVASTTSTTTRIPATSPIPKPTTQVLDKGETVIAGSTISTRPLLVNNLMIDPISGTTTPLGGGGFGGGGGGGAEEKSSTVAAQKKSWLPFLLITVGTGLILSTFIKNKKYAK